MPTDDLAKVIKFLLGEAELDGEWFGDHSAGRNRYWWRKELRKRWIVLCDQALQPAPLAAQVRNDALEEAAKVCEEMESHYSAYKDTALLNGDIALSNAASGEPRACEFLAQAIRNLQSQQVEHPDTKDADDTNIILLALAHAINAAPTLGKE